MTPKTLRPTKKKHLGAKACIKDDSGHADHKHIEACRWGCGSGHFSFVRSFVRSFAFLCPDSLGQKIKFMIILYTSSDNAAAITMQIQII